MQSPLHRTSGFALKTGALLLLVLLPLAGLLLEHAPIAAYLEFPPLTRYVKHAPFSWAAFVLLAALLTAVLAPFEMRVLRSRRTARPAPPPRRRFPWWGWIALLAGTATWSIAWSYFECVGPLQAHTFTPLWLSYIAVVNALTYRRTGRCMLTHEPRYLAKLFLLSAGFWWFFEYLNRFVQNWYYDGVAGMSPLEYFLFATLPFATVLPAVMGTYDWFDSCPRAGAGLDDFIRIRISRPRAVAWPALIAACGGLAGIGVEPDTLFPLLWISPLIIITALQAIVGQQTIFAAVEEGRWRRLYLLAAAALLCGFFWELWNFGSLAHWKYSVPFVDRFHCFEMPVLGYAGYLPFGLECAVIAAWIRRKNHE